MLINNNAKISNKLNTFNTMIIRSYFNKCWINNCSGTKQCKFTCFAFNANLLVQN